jgi:hypothetical protein
MYQFDDPPKKQQEKLYTLDEAVSQIAQHYRVPDALWRRMIRQESGGKASALSPKGARTAWQIMPGTARALGYSPEELDRDPLKAAEAGLRYLRDNYHQVKAYLPDDNSRWQAAVAAYHAGPGNVVKHLKSGGNGLGNWSDGLITTKQHVKRIFSGLQPSALGAIAAPMEPSAPSSLPVYQRPHSIIGDVPDTSNFKPIPLEFDPVSGQYVAPQPQAPALPPAPEEPLVSTYTGSVPNELGPPDHQQLLPESQVPLPEPTPVPEAPATLDAQQQAASQPESTRIATLFTPGEKLPLRPRTQTDIKLDDGRVLRADKGKLMLYMKGTGLKRADIVQGRTDLTPLIGGKANPSDETSGKLAVATADTKDGKELVSSTVDDPAAIGQEAALQQAQFPNKQTETVITTSDAVAQARQQPPVEQAADITDAEYQQYAEYETRQGRQPLSHEDLIKAANSAVPSSSEHISAGVDPRNYNVVQSDAQNTSDAQQKEIQPVVARPQLVEAKTEAEQRYGAASPAFSFDLKTKPHGINTGAWLVRQGLQGVAAEYGLTGADIDWAVKDLKNRKGSYTNRSDNITDEEIAAGRQADPFQITNGLISDILNHRDGLPSEKLHPEIRNRIAIANAQIDKSPEVSKQDFGILPEAEAEKKLTERIQQPDYVAQETASRKLGELVNDPMSYVAPWYTMGKQALEALPAVDDKWVQDEKDRLIKENGSFAKALQKEGEYQNADLLEKTIRVSAQVGRSFLQNVVSGTGKGVVYAGEMFDKLLDSPNPITIFPLNKILPDALRPNLRNAGNALDLITRVLTSNSAAQAYNEWEKTYVGPDEPIKKQQLFKAMQEFDKAIGQDPVLKGRFLGQLADAGGSALAFMATGLLTPELSVSTKLGEFGITPALWGALSQAGTGYEEGTQNGLDEKKAQTYGAIQGVLGLTEGFGIGGQAGRLVKNPLIRTQLAEGILEVAKRGVLKEGGEEFLQELVQTTGGKVALEYLKDNDPSVLLKLKNVFSRLPKQVTQTVTNEGLIAFLSGGAMGGVSHGAQLAIDEQVDGQQADKVQDTSNDENKDASLPAPVKEDTATVETGDTTPATTVRKVRDKKTDAVYTVLEDRGDKLFVKDEKGAQSLKRSNAVTDVEVPKVNQDEPKATLEPETIPKAPPESNTIPAPFAMAAEDHKDAIAAEPAPDTSTSQPKEAAAPEITKGIQKPAGSLTREEILARPVSKPRRQFFRNRSGIDKAASTVPNAKRPDALMSKKEQKAPVFYSHAERTIAEKMPNSAPALQVRNLLSAQNGVKKEELDWLGIDQWLQDHPKPTRDEVLTFIRENNAQVHEVIKGRRQWRGDELMAGSDRIANVFKDDDGTWHYLSDFSDGSEEYSTRAEAEAAAEEEVANDPYSTHGTKFSQYTLPGGENYRELLLTLPTGVRNAEEIDKEMDALHEKGDINTDPELNARHRELTRERAIAKGDNKTSFYSRHWDEPNVLAHIRFDTRDNGKTLHIAEIQSDMHQQGREHGYKGQLLTEIPKDYGIRQTSSGRHMLEHDGRLMSTENFSTADEARQYLLQKLNSDRWDKGVPNAPFKKSWQELAMKRAIRYAAENGYDRITWDTGDTQADRYDLSKYVSSIRWQKVGSGFALDIYKDGKEISHDLQMPSVLSADQLPNYVGKEVAEKIRTADGNSGKLTGTDLQVGGHGMRGFYDKLLPNFVNKYVKKWGGKVEDGTVDATGDALNVHSLDITPAMRESVLRGQPLFKVRDQENEDLLYNVLPKASDADVLNGMSGGEITKADDLELNPYDGEMLRRLFSEFEFYKSGIDVEHDRFDGVVVDAEDLKEVADLGRDLQKQLADGDFSDDHIHAFGKLLDNIDDLAVRSKDFGIAYIFDDALPEEKFHQEDLRLGRTDRHALSVLKESPLWNFGGTFDRLYKNLSDADKASEIAAKLATDQAETMGWSEIENFEDVKRSFLENWLDGILRRNNAKITAEGAETFLREFERVYQLYADLKKSHTGRISESEGRQGPDGPDAGTDEGSGPPGPEEIATTSDTERAADQNETETRSETDILQAAQQESLDSEKIEAEALDVPLSEVRTKNRKYAQTLRDNGRDARDVPYIPGSDPQTIESVKKILQESRDAADNSDVPYGDYEHAISVLKTRRRTAGHGPLSASH